MKCCVTDENVAPIDAQVLEGTLESITYLHENRKLVGKNVLETHLNCYTLKALILLTTYVERSHL